LINVLQGLVLGRLITVPELAEAAAVVVVGLADAVVVVVGLSVGDGVIIVCIVVVV